MEHFIGKQHGTHYSQVHIEHSPGWIIYKATKHI